MSQDAEAQLTLKDRLNYPYYIGDAILTCSKAVLLQENSEREIIEATKNLRSLIPKSWEDKEFQDDLKEAKVVRSLDVRPLVTGSTRMSEEACRELGIPTSKEEVTYDYEKLRTACINLLDRRGYTSKVTRVEELEGLDFASITENDLRKGKISRQ